MKSAKKYSLYAMSIFYIGAGILHLIFSHIFLLLMPVWVPAPIPMIILSGFVEIILGTGLLFEKTRKISAWLIIAMLVTYFFVNHVTMSVDYFKTDNNYFWLTVLRLPIQFLLIWWAWTFAKPVKVSNK